MRERFQRSAPFIRFALRRQNAVRVITVQYLMKRVEADLIEASLFAVFVKCLRVGRIARRIDRRAVIRGQNLIAFERFYEPSPCRTDFPFWRRLILQDW